MLFSKNIPKIELLTTLYHQHDVYLKVFAIRVLLQTTLWYAPKSPEKSHRVYYFAGGMASRTPAIIHETLRPRMGTLQQTSTQSITYTPRIRQ